MNEEEEGSGLFLFRFMLLLGLIGLIGLFLVAAGMGSGL